MTQQSGKKTVKYSHLIISHDPHFFVIFYKYKYEYILGKFICVFYNGFSSSKYKTTIYFIALTGKRLIKCV